MEITYHASTNISYNHVVQNIAHLTFPSISKKIAAQIIHEPYTGVWAMVENKMAGVILSDGNQNGISELFSFYVIPTERRKGIGNQLMQILLQTLKSNEVKQVRTRYWSNWGNIAGVEKLLALNNWQRPGLIRTIAQGKIESFPHVNWPSLHFSDSFTTFNWNEITADEVKDIEARVKTGEIPPSFNPLLHSEKIFSGASTGLRNHGILMGWNIVYEQTTERLEYNNLFLYEAFRNRGLAIMLLHNSLMKQYELKIPEVTWLINSDNTVAGKIFGHLFDDLLTKKIEVFGSYINL